MMPTAFAERIGEISGDTATCSIQIPFYWAMEETSVGVGVSYEIEVPGGLKPVRARGTAIAPYPPPGGVGHFSTTLGF
jgi:hypothetical protein